MICCGLAGESVPWAAIRKEERSLCVGAGGAGFYAEVGRRRPWPNEKYLAVPQTINMFHVN